MDANRQSLEEQLTLMQADQAQMSEELYAQQKEIAHLRLMIDALTRKLQSLETDDGILRPDEDQPPPHY
jgi:SlyX protein